MTNEEDLFIDANIFISIFNNIISDSHIAMMDKKRGVRLLDFSSAEQLNGTVKKTICEIENNQTICEQIYAFLSGSNTRITEGVKNQINEGNNKKLKTLEWCIKERAEEYLYIQLNPAFNTNLQNRAKQNMSTFLIYKKLIKSLSETINSEPYIPSLNFPAIEEYIKAINKILKLQKVEHKEDNGTDEKLAASVFDNIISNRRKTIIASNDLDLYNMVRNTYLLISSASHIGNEKLEFLLNNSPSIYEFTANNTFREYAYSSNFKAANAERLGKDNLNEIGRLANLTIELLRQVDLY